MASTTEPILDDTEDRVIQPVSIEQLSLDELALLLRKAMIQKDGLLIARNGYKDLFRVKELRVDKTYHRLIELEHEAENRIDQINSYIKSYEA